jgi:hypothetical protein
VKEEEEKEEEEETVELKKTMRERCFLVLVVVLRHRTEHEVFICV